MTSFFRSFWTTTSSAPSKIGSPQQPSPTHEAATTASNDDWVELAIDHKSGSVIRVWDPSSQKQRRQEILMHIVNAYIEKLSTTSSSSSESSECKNSNAHQQSKKHKLTRSMLEGYAYAPTAAPFMLPSKLKRGYQSRSVGAKHLMNRKTTHPISPTPLKQPMKPPAQ